MYLIVLCIETLAIGLTVPGCASGTVVI